MTRLISALYWPYFAAYVGFLLGWVAASMGPSWLLLLFGIPIPIWSSLKNQFEDTDA